MRSNTPTVVIVGAGFSGTLVAAHLLGGDARRPLRVVMVNKSGRLARGVAYGTRSSRHVLNVPAGRMSAFAADEDDFLRFARQRDPAVSGGTFVPRQLYGQYLEHVLLSAQSRGPRGTVLEHVADEVIDVLADDAGSRARVVLAEGPPIPTDAVVLALGNYLPSNPSLGDAAIFRSPAYVRDPWAPGALDGIAADAPLFLLGTGLTMVDVALELQSRGHTAPMMAVSRRGLLPQPHRPAGAPPSYAHLPPDLVACGPRAVEYVRAVRRHVRHVSAAGVDWRDVVASLRPVTPRLWARLDDVERARFLRHVRPYWDVHRHRMAPELWQGVQAMVQSGGLTIRAGRLIRAAEHASGIRVEYQRRGQHALETVEVARLVNCTGPESDVRRVQDRLLSALLVSGQISTDALGLGLRVTDSLAVVRADGSPSPAISLVGPLLKGRFWEATAVPELRVHAAALAWRLQRDLGIAPERQSA